MSCSSLFSCFKCLGCQTVPRQICIWLDVHMSSRLGTIILRKVKGLKIGLMKALDINSYITAEKFLYGGIVIFSLQMVSKT